MISGYGYFFSDDFISFLLIYSEPVTVFFNHRIFAQFYQIWRKYAYSVTFASGGSDRISQCTVTDSTLSVMYSLFHRQVKTLRLDLTLFLIN
ncbi:type VI secretion system baseplate subunit TssG [Photorhabdus sp. SF281]|uniref:type VI secretion system baseplate subunit TssG n=1 Tax=Photorhabdus sp. SF281 TaxID=3459527 RepID=UPI004044F068